MFITHSHLKAIRGQVVRICATIKWPETCYAGPSWPDGQTLDRLEQMGFALETSLLSYPGLLSVYSAIRQTFRDLSSGNPRKKSHENLRDNLRAICHTVDTVIEDYPARPLGMVEEAGLSHFCGGDLSLSGLPTNLYPDKPFGQKPDDTFAKHRQKRCRYADQKVCLNMSEFS